MGMAVEEVIREAMAEGKFANLPGEGRPLRLDPSPDAVVKGILRHARYNPDWADVGLSIERTLQNAEAICSRYSAVYEADCRHLRELQAASAASPVAGRRRWRQSANPDYAAARAAAAELLARRRLTLSRYAALLHQANALIRRYNSLMPVAGQQRVLLVVETMLAEFLRRFPRPDATGAEVELVAPELLCPPASGPTMSGRCRHAYELLRSVRRPRR